MADAFQDHYELLELSPNANLETIERVFRYLATKWHPDAGGEKNKFTQLVKAFETLRDPAARQAYDVEYQKHQHNVAKLVENAGEVRRDTVDRNELLTVFYAKRRQDAKNPGLGIATVERLMNCPEKLLEFHLWYFREKNWIKREENGGFSITAAGVDRIESTQTVPGNDRRLLEAQRGAYATGELVGAGNPN